LPPPAHRSFADPFGNILGSKCTGATIRPNFFWFFLFCIAFGSFLFVILFFFFSKQNASLQARTRAARGRGRISLHWTTEALIFIIPRPSPHLSHPSKLFGILKKYPLPLSPTPAPPIAASLFLLANNPLKNHSIGLSVISH
jgi:hypothetical protein